VTTRHAIQLSAVLTLLALAASVLSPHDAATAPAALGKVTDRTLLCSVTAVAPGVHQFEIRVHAGFRADRSSWQNLPFAVVRSGRVVSPAFSLDIAFGWVAAGRVSEKSNLDSEGEVFPAVHYGTVALNNRVCKPSSATVPLTTRGLQGGSSGALGDQFDCTSPQRVLVRLRAVARSVARYYPEQQFVKTKATLRTGYIAVRTRAGKPLAFAAVFQSGRARIFTARNCVPD
jgi:hypothetical protein